MFQISLDFCIIRISAASGSVNAKPALKQLKYSEPGYFRYERDHSRDGNIPNPQKLGDTPSRFLFRRLGHAYELYPLIFLLGFWVVIFVYIVYISFEKIEVWVDRSQSVAPWDWSRVRDKYWKLPTLAFDREGVTHQRLEIMERIQDDMLEAAIKRGTRS